MIVTAAVAWTLLTGTALMLLFWSLLAVPEHQLYMM